jgi:hypothetical protein
MYADDTVIYACKEQTTSYTRTHYSNGPDDKVVEGLMLSSQCKTKQSACSSQRGQLMPLSQMAVSGEKLQVVSDLKYHGIILDSNLSFKKQMKKVTHITKLNLAKFQNI